MAIRTLYFQINLYLESAVESIAGTGVSSESKKENSILGKLGMMRYKKCKSRSPTVDLATVRARAATVDDKLLNDVRIRPGPTSPNIAAKSPKKKLAPKADGTYVLERSLNLSAFRVQKIVKKRYFHVQKLLYQYH